MINGAFNLRFEYQTGSPAYYYLNDIITIGVVTQAGNYTGGSILKIVTWYL
jgi:hypothetical protein